MIYIRAVGKLFTGYSSLSNRQGGRSPTSKGWGGRFQFFDFTTMGDTGQLFGTIRNFSYRFEVGPELTLHDASRFTKYKHVLQLILTSFT